MTSKEPSRVWLITGSSTGFGRHLAEAALAQGDRVIVTAHDVSQIQELESKYPRTAKAVRLDVTNQDSIHEYIRGDAATGVQAMLKVVELLNPPLRLALGPATLPTLIQKLSSDIEEYQRFEDIWQASTANAKNE